MSKSPEGQGRKAWCQFLEVLEARLPNPGVHERGHFSLPVFDGPRDGILHRLPDEGVWDLRVA